MGLLDRTSEDPHTKARRYAISGVALALLLAFFVWWLLRFATERATAERFMDAVVAGNYQQAYEIWKPLPSYTYQDFLNDWGEHGYYAPIGSYRIEDVDSPGKGGSGVIVTIAISPVNPFPSAESADSRRTRIVRLWIERRDQSISFPP